MDPKQTHPDRARAAGHRNGLLLATGFGLLALLMLSRPGASLAPGSTPRSVDPASLIPGPRRTAMADPAAILISGTPQSCSGCHQIFTPVTKPLAQLGYHEQVKLSHGLNNRCANCHDQQDSQRLVLHDQSTVPFAQAPLMCAQCHGTVYRDWQRGTHGKTLGSWITGAASQRRLVCNECHDPHAPRYTPIEPLPGPDTLRMGDQQHHETHTDPRRTSPLQRWLTTRDTMPAPQPSLRGAHP